MGSGVKLRTGSVSITGNFRENNEDRCHVDPQARFVLVADGLFEARGNQFNGEFAGFLTG